MQASSRPISSNQSTIHPRLQELVRRHLQKPEHKPLADHNREAFETIRKRHLDDPRPLVFDSFCGTGRSSVALAAKYPQYLVVGIDKSAHRLARHPGGDADNYLLVQADCEPIWRQAAEQGWRLQHHFLLYPNPWPKSGQVQRRVHGCAAFPYLLTLGGQLELRTNWQLYAEEFLLALTVADQQGQIERLEPRVPVTQFEEKYLQSGHQLWACHATLVSSDKRDAAAD